MYSGSKSVENVVFKVVPSFPKWFRFSIWFSENDVCFLKSIMETLNMGGGFEGHVTSSGDIQNSWILSGQVS